MKIGDWVEFKLYGERRVGVIHTYVGRAIMVNHCGDFYHRTIKELTEIPPELYPLLESAHDVKGK